jgi:putative cell wall-binding protein
MSRPVSSRALVFFMVAVVMAIAGLGGVAVAAPVTYSFVGTVGPGAGASPYNEPNSVDTDWAGRVWVAEYTGARLQWFGAGGSGFIDSYTGWTSPSAGSYGRLFGLVSDKRTGNLYVGDPLLHRIRRLAGGSDVLLNNIGGSTPGSDDYLSSSRGLALDPWGTLYASDTTSNTVRAFRPQGTFLGTIGSSEAADGGLNDPRAVGWDYDGRLYVASFAGRAVSVFDRYRSFDTSWFAATRTLCFDPGDNLFVVDSPFISRVTTGGVELERFGGGGSPFGFYNIEDVRSDGERNLYVADGGDGIGGSYPGKVVKIHAPVPTKYEVTAGGGRYDTAIRISQAAYPRGLERTDPSGWRSVVIATGENWPDALGASALAGAADCPILLVKKTLPLPAGLTAELARLGAGRAFVVGGTGAGPDDVADAIDTALPGPDSIVRIAGGSRYETSWLVANRVALWGYADKAFVATGLDFPDALSAAPMAAANKWPVYLADPKRSFVASMTVNGATRAVILGGTGSVPASAEASLVAAFGAPDVSRWAGGNRYHTSAIIAAKAVDLGVSPYPLRANRVALATGLTFPDGLAGGPLQAKSWGPMLLTRPTALPPEAATWLAARKNAVYHVRFLGGDGAVGPAVRNAVKPLLY